MSTPIPLGMIFEKFKFALKQKGMTYADLANELSMSESGVKKMFSASDCSYSKLNHISQFLDIELTDVMISSKKHEIVEVRFSLEQENYFIKNPVLFSFFWKLIQERLDVKTISKELKFTEKQTFLHLKKLDEFGVIELHAHNKVKIPKMEQVRWMGNGPLLKWIKNEWPKQLILEVSAKENLSLIEHYSLRYYQLTKKSHEELVTRIQTLDSEFAERSLREMKIGKKLGLVRMVSAIAPGSYV